MGTPRQDRVLQEQGQTVLWGERCQEDAELLHRGGGGGIHGSRGRVPFLPCKVSDA